MLLCYVWYHGSSFREPGWPSVIFCCQAPRNLCFYMYVCVCVCVLFIYSHHWSSPYCSHCFLEFWQAHLMLIAKCQTVVFFFLVQLICNFTSGLYVRSQFKKNARIIIVSIRNLPLWWIERIVGQQLITVRDQTCRDLHRGGIGGRRLQCMPAFSPKSCRSLLYCQII